MTSESASLEIILRFFLSGKLRLGVGNRGRYVVGIHVLWKGIGSRYDVRTHAEPARGLDRDGGVIAGYHLDPHTFFICHIDCRLGIVAWRIEHRQYAEQRPGMPRVLGASDAQRARAVGCKLIDGFLNPLCDIGRRLGEVDDHLGRILSRTEHTVTRLDRLNLTDSQQRDPVTYEPGQIVE